MATIVSKVCNDIFAVLVVVIIDGTKNQRKI